jgi:hypothetical protein
MHAPRDGGFRCAESINTRREPIPMPVGPSAARPGTNLSRERSGNLPGAPRSSLADAASDLEIVVDESHLRTPERTTMGRLNLPVRSSSPTGALALPTDGAVGAARSDGRFAEAPTSSGRSPRDDLTLRREAQTQPALATHPHGREQGLGCAERSSLGRRRRGHRVYWWSVWSQSRGAARSGGAP